MTGLTVFYYGGLLWINRAAGLLGQRTHRAETTRAIEIEGQPILGFSERITQPSSYY